MNPIKIYICFFIVKIDNELNWIENSSIFFIIINLLNVDSKLNF